MLEMKNTALTEQHTHIIEKYTCESNGVLTSNYWKDRCKQGKK
jgi:hypothetical protein